MSVFTTVNIKVRTWILAFLLSLFTGQVSGQQFTPIYENIVDGLPSTEVHDIFQDSIGYVWFATDRGICKYDGNRFQQIDVESTLNTKVIFKFFKQTETKVWIVSKNKRLYWFNPTDKSVKFHENKYNDQLELILNNSKYVRFVSSISFSKNDLYIFFKWAPGYIQINSKTGCRLVEGQEDIPESQMYATNIELKQINGHNYTYLKEPNKDRQQNGYIQLNSKVLSSFYFESNFSFGVACELQLNKTNYVAVSDILIASKNNNISFIQLPSKIICLGTHKGDLLVGTYNGIFRVNPKLELQDSFFQECAITRIFCDRNDNYWISTLKNGVLLVRNFGSKKMLLPEPFTPGRLLSFPNALIVHDNTNNLSLLFNENDYLIGKYSDFYTSTVKYSFVKNQQLISALDLSRKDYAEIEKVRNLTMVVGLLYDEGGSEQYFYETGAICKIAWDRIDFLYRHNTANHFVFSTQSNQGTLLIGSQNGLFSFDISSKTLADQPIPNSQEIGFNAYVKLRDTYIFATTDGICTYDHNGLQQVSGSEGILFTGIFQKDNTHAWAYSENRIYNISLKDDRIKLTEFKLDFEQENMVLISLVEFNNKLWLITKRGVYTAELKLDKPTSNSPQLTFLLDSIRLNKQIIPLRHGIKLYSEDKLQLFFSTISFNHMQDKPLEYSLDGKNWFETNRNSLTVSEFSFGDNTLLIRSVGKPDQILLRLPIYKAKHFYQTIWFWLLSSLIVLLFMSWLILKIERKSHEKKMKELATLNLELKLLTSKMNPHFTFNTINSIQHFILKSDKKEAIKYLSDFALLMRKSLDFSMEERIILLREKEFIELYIQLENKRFNSNFILDFSCTPPEIIYDKKIPSMLIQPLVENVILHANYGPLDEKLIKITISLENEYFTIKIIDFGMGINNSQKQKDHKSYGIDILRSRIKLYNGKDYSIEDLTIFPTNAITKRGATVTIKLKEWIQ